MKYSEIISVIAVLFGAFVVVLLIGWRLGLTIDESQQLLVCWCSR